MGGIGSRRNLLLDPLAVAHWSCPALTDNGIMDCEVLEWSPDEHFEAPAQGNSVGRG